MIAFEFLIVFITGYNFAVPGYGWAVAVQPAHAVFLDHILFAAYVIVCGVPRGWATRSNAVIYVGLIGLLALLSLITAAFNPTRVEDIGAALRLMLLAAYTFHAINWTRTRGSTFVLRALLCGVGFAGALNLYVSFVHPYMRIAFLPALYARNGTGGPLGLAVVLGAWLFSIRRKPADSYVAVVSSVIGVAAATISFSKTSMLVGVCGIFAWALVLAKGMTLHYMRSRIAISLALLTAAGVYVSRLDSVADLVSSFRYSLGIKFASAALTLSDQASTQWRYEYFWGVSEIVAKHPIAGVGPSGFYDAIIATQPFQAGLMSQEDPQARTQGGANPHNSFLFIAASNGIPGFVIGMTLFFGFLIVLERRLRVTGAGGLGLWSCIALAFFIFGMTLPNLFNTMVMYLPAAVSIGLRSQPDTEEALVLGRLPQPSFA